MPTSEPAMVTAETITRRQISALRAESPDLERECQVALARADAVAIRLGISRKVTLARCAAAWNARHGGGR